MTGWLVYACRSSYAPEVAEIIWRRGEEVTAFVDNLAGPPWTSDLAPVVTDLAGLLSHQVVIPLITPGHRFAVQAQARARGLQRFPRLVDPTAIVARTASVDDGVVVNAGVVVGAGTRIGRFVHVNRSASIGHDDVLEDYCTIGPGCVLAGHVRVCGGAFLGAGAVCAPEVTVGRNAVVGAGAVVVRDVPEGAVVVGNPARVLRTSDTGYGGVVVP